MVYRARIVISRRVNTTKPASSRRDTARDGLGTIVLPKLLESPRKEVIGDLSYANKYIYTKKKGSRC